MSGEKPQGSAYGTGAPTYENAEQQKHHLDGRIKFAQSRVEGYTVREPDPLRAAKWQRILDELLDRRLEVMGR